jgi:hypothetical protein
VQPSIAETAALMRQLTQFFAQITIIGAERLLTDHRSVFFNAHTSAAC